MASRTQLRLQQLTGSTVNMKTEAQHYVTPQTAALLTGSDVQDLFGMVGAALNRIHGAASSEPFNNPAGTIRSEANSAEAIKLHADAGTLQTIQLLNDEGTSSEAIDIEATAGGFSIDGVKASNISVNSSADADDLIIQVAGATNSSLILASSGTGADAIDINAVAGDILVGKALADTKSLKLGRASRAQMVITPDNATPANANISIINTEGTATNAIKIDAEAGGIDVDAAGVLDLVSSQASAGAIIVNASHANGDIDLKIAGTSVVHVDAADVTVAQDTTFSENVTITGNLTVSGDTTTVNTTNLTVEDSIIGLGITGSTFSNTGDRGFIFARGTVGAALPGFWWDGSQFNLATSITSPVSESFGVTSEYKKLQVGDLSIFNGVNKRGDIKVVNNDLVISSSAGNDLMLDSNSGKIFLQKDTIAAGFLQIDPGVSGEGLILSSSAQEGLILDSNPGVISFGKGSEDNGPKVNAVIGGGANEDKISFVKSNDQTDTHFTLQVQSPTNGAIANQFAALSGSLKLFANNATNLSVALNGDSVTENYNLSLPTGNATATNQVLAVSAFNAGQFTTDLAFTDISSLIAPSKAVRIVTGSGLPAGENVAFTSGQITVGDAISGLNQTLAQGKTLDVFVNGQLLVSGSDLQIGVNASRDYSIQPSNNSLKFAFDLEADDVIQLIKR